MGSKPCKGAFIASTGSMSSQANLSPIGHGVLAPEGDAHTWSSCAPVATNPPKCELLVMCEGMSQPGNDTKELYLSLNDYAKLSTNLVFINGSLSMQSFIDKAIGFLLHELEGHVLWPMGP
jgi:hypothetical protein